jgi:hypothetical protein
MAGRERTMHPRSPLDQMDHALELAACRARIRAGVDVHATRPVFVSAEHRLRERRPVFLQRSLKRVTARRRARRALALAVVGDP